MGIEPAVGIREILFILIILLILFGIPIIVIRWIIISQRTVQVCPSCGTHIRGKPQLKCPTCGAEFGKHSDEV